MASNLKYSAVLKNAQQAAITTTVGTSALILIYSGTQPTNPDTAITSQVLLATLTCSATFAPAPSAGVLTLNAITSGGVVVFWLSGGAVYQTYLIECAITTSQGRTDSRSSPLTCQIR